MKKALYLNIALAIAIFTSLVIVGKTLQVKQEAVQQDLEDIKELRAEQEVSGVNPHAPGFIEVPNGDVYRTVCILPSTGHWTYNKDKRRVTLKFISCEMKVIAWTAVLPRPDLKASLHF